MDKFQVLKQFFGYDGFRPGQEKLIDAILSGRDVLGILPTGAGKSICFQIPALMMGGITLVISPLISLMKDQVASLNQAGVHAAYLNSSLTMGQYRKALAFAKEGRYKIIYVAPERLETAEFMDFAMSVDISMIAVDEAHCVSQWGQDFRPSYLKITEFVEYLPKRPVVSAPGQERFTRLKTLGADYTEEAIRERIAGRRAKAAKAPREQRGVSLLIDIENSIKAAQSKGYEQWAKIHNLKQAAKTMNFLTEHKIEQYADLVSRIEEMAAESGQAADALKDAEKRLADMAVLIKNVSTYQKTKPVYDAYRKARNREKYRAGQEQAIILHEAAARSLKAAGIAKLPNLAALQSEYEALQAQKEALYADYGKLKKKVREYDIIKQNIDSILQADRQPEREKGTERG